MQATGVYDIVELVLNSLLFILIGMEVGAILRDPGAPPLLDLLRTTAIVTAAVVLARIAWMYPSAYLPRLWPSVRKPGGDADPRRGGAPFVDGHPGRRLARGSVGAPSADGRRRPVPESRAHRHEHVGVIVATLLLQGLTLGPLIKLLRLPADKSLDAEIQLAHREMAAAAQAWLEQAAPERVAPAAVLERVRGHYARKARLELALDGAGDDRVDAEAYRHAEQGVIGARRRAAVSLRDRGVIDDEVLARVERELDLEELRVAPDEDG